MKIYNFIFFGMFLICLSGCAAGSATAGYALRASTADSLTVAGEKELIERIKEEIHYQ